MITTFERSVSAAISNIEKKLASDRTGQVQQHAILQPPSSTPHSFTDKYILVETAIRTAIASITNTLGSLSPPPPLSNDPSTPSSPLKVPNFLHEMKASMKEASNLPVTLQFSSSEFTTYLGTSERIVGGDRSITIEHSSTNSGIFGKRKSVSENTTLVKEKVTDHNWNTATSFSLSIISGTDVASAKSLISVKDQTRLHSSRTIDNPRSHVGGFSNKNEPVKVINHKPIKLYLTFLLSKLDATSNTSTFKINRDDQKS